MRGGRGGRTWSAKVGGGGDRERGVEEHGGCAEGLERGEPDEGRMRGAVGAILERKWEDGEQGCEKGECKGGQERSEHARGGGDGEHGEGRGHCGGLQLDKVGKHREWCDAACGRES